MVKFICPGCGGLFPKYQGMRFYPGGILFCKACRRSGNSLAAIAEKQVLAKRERELTNRLYRAGRKE